MDCEYVAEIDDIGMRVVIPGVPIGQPRPRLGRGMVYDPDGHAKKVIRGHIEDIKSWAEPYQGPVSVVVTFEIPPPKSASKKRMRDLFDGRHTSKPDIDNMAKRVLDILNGIAYVDDNQVYILLATKKYSPIGRTVVTITEDGANEKAPMPESISANVGTR